MTYKNVFDEIFNSPITDESSVDKNELKMGIEVEKEHGTRIDVRKQIALAHLKEIPDYYTRLKKMEQEANK